MFVLAQNVVLMEPGLQGSFHVAVREGCIAPAFMLQRHAQETNPVLRCRKELSVESVQVVMGDVPKRQGEPDIEGMRKLTPGKIRFHEPDELLGKLGLLVGLFPFRGGELVCGEILDIAENGWFSVFW